MTPVQTAAADAARRLWARIAGDADVADGIPASAERMCVELRAGLGRWIGADGYRALVDRALAIARADHPALGGLTFLGGEEPAIGAAVRAHGAGAVLAGLAALVATLIELLGRIIGNEMAIHLVEQTAIPSQRRVAQTMRKRAHDG